LYKSPSVAKRNLTILPCDDGNFDPNYEILNAERLSNKFVDSAGNIDLSRINLESLVSPPAPIAIGSYDPDGASFTQFSNVSIGPTPESPGAPPGVAYLSHIAEVSASIVAAGSQEETFDRGVQKGLSLTIFQRLLDPSSNQVTFFNFSNLFYGRKIKPESFMIRDSGISGSNGAVPITLRDNGFGGLYRADSETTHDLQNVVGSIFYDEGIVVIKSPHLYFFGKEQYEISFKGVKNIFSTKYEIVATAGALNSSSNATYTSTLSASADFTDTDQFVYISGINFHDENMNIVAKAKLAQPVMKREHDKLLFKVAIDF
jgi:hypothetical protein